MIDSIELIVLYVSLPYQGINYIVQGKKDQTTVHSLNMHYHYRPTSNLHLHSHIESYI